VFDIRLRTIAESTWKILKLDWNFFIQKSRNPVIDNCAAEFLIHIMRKAEL